MSTFVRRLLRRAPDGAGRLPRPRLLPRLTMLLLSSTVLVLLAASFADHPADPPDWLDPFGVIGWVVTRVRYISAGVGALFGVDADAAAVIGARVEFFVVAMTVVVSARWLKFWALTVRPGPIEVVRLEDAVAAEAEAGTERAALCTYLTMMLREKLSSVSVYLPTPAPGDAVGGGFLQTMRESTRETWWASTIEFVNRVIPRSAYRVDGAVLRRAGHDESYGISVRVTVFPRQRTVASTVWARTPEVAVDRAARTVAAAILPLTRRCLASPWRHWYGRSLPVELLEEYEAASAFREQRRYDEALGRYRAALEQDSLNPLIRVEMAQLQEQLGLYLDALANYASALALWSGSPERYNSWLHRRQVAGTGRRRFTAWQRLSRWRRYGSPFLIRFRYATALAYFEKLTVQWVKPAASDPRARERIRLRHLLVRMLAERYGPVWGEDRSGPLPMTHSRTATAEGLRARLEELTSVAERGDGDDAAMAVITLRRFFLMMSRYELQQLTRDHRSWFGWVADTALTARSLRLARDSWIDIRLRVARERVDVDRPALSDHDVEALLAKLDSEVHRNTRKSTVWIDHYNAACVYGQALVLIGDDERHRPFARAAVKELFTGLQSVDSAHVSRQRSWILSEDADLRELRKCGEFQPFAAMVGPAGGPVVLRPAGTQIAELSEYQTRLLLECARTMEWRWGTWADTPEHERDDGHAWWRVHQLAVAHRNWPDRLDAITYFQQRPADAPSVGRRGAGHRDVQPVVRGPRGRRTRQVVGRVDRAGKPVRDPRGTVDTRQLPGRPGAHHVHAPAGWGRVRPRRAVAVSARDRGERACREERAERP